MAESTRDTERVQKCQAIAGLDTWGKGAKQTGWSVYMDGVVRDLQQDGPGMHGHCEWAGEADIKEKGVISILSLITCERVVSSCFEAQ